MKTLRSQRTALYKFFEKLKKNNQGNLFDIALGQADLYINNYDFSREGKYIKALKKHDLFIRLIEHLGNANARGKEFPFDKELKKVNENIEKVREFIYKCWKERKLVEDEVRLNHPTIEIKEAYTELVNKFTPYDVEDRQKIKQVLGLKR